MSISRSLAQFGVAAVLAGWALGSAPAANAQIMSVALPGQEAAAGGGGTASNRNIGVAIFPYAAWRFDVKGAGEATADGLLFAVEATFAAPEGRSGGYGFGGWYWNSQENNVGDTFELHGKYYFTPKFGIQLGYVGFTDPSGSGYDAYLTYNAASKASDAETGKGGYSLEIGAGVYGERGEEFNAAGQVTGKKTFTYGSAFIAGSYDIAKQVSLNASVWYVGDDEFSATRLGLGVGYRFL